MAKEWNLPYMRKDGIKFRILRGYPGEIIFANAWQPKYHHMYLYKKEAEGVWNKSIQRRSHVKTEAEIRVMWPQTKEACTHQKLGEASRLGSQWPDSHLGFCWGWAFVICAFLCYFKNMHKKMKMFWGCEKWSLFTFLHSICRRIPQQAIFLTLLFAQWPDLCLTQSTCPVRMLGEWMSFHIICLLRILSSEFHIYILFLFPWAPEAAESAIEGESWAGAGAALPRT